MGFGRGKGFSPPPGPPGPPGPTPYTGSWGFYAFLTCRPAGELYLGLATVGLSHSAIYYTENYGDSWEPVIDDTHPDLDGRRPLHMMPSSIGLLLAAYGGADAPYGYRVYSAPSIDGSWTSRLGTEGYSTAWRGRPNFWRTNGGEHVWFSGLFGYTGTRWILCYSSNGGLNWSGAFAYAANLNPGQVRVNAVESKGFLGTITTGASEQMRYSDNPTATPGTWSTPGIGSRAYRFGVCWPYIVVPYGTTYWYSSDNGHTGSDVAIPAGMQTGGSYHYYTGIDMSPFNRNWILSAPPGVTKGIWLSTDFGASWTQVKSSLGAGGATFPNCVMFDLFHPEKAYAWGDTGFFRSNDSGATWEERSYGLEQGQS